MSNGQRLSKSVNGITTEYIYNNGLLLAEKTEDETIYYYYDSNGEVVSIGYQKGTDKETRYFFSRNAQGDVIGIYRNSDSKLIGTYEYDLWGAIVSVKEASAGIDADGILQKNPIRYRSYYYDNETGLYYLNARYYDPQIRRFISADNISFLGVGSTIQSLNLFAYCENNPINKVDSSGHFSWKDVAIIACCVVIVALAALIVIGTGGAAGGGIALALAGGGESLVGALAATTATEVLTEVAIAGTAVAVSSLSIEYADSIKDGANNESGEEKDYVKAKNNKQANEWAREVEYEDAEHLKKDYVGKEGSKFDIYLNRKNREIIMIGKKTGIEINTHLLK